MVYPKSLFTGRPLQPLKVQNHGVITVSFPQKDRQLLLNLNQSAVALQLTRSDLIRDAIYMMYNVSSLVELEEIILDKYGRGIYIIPDDIERTFPNVLDYELQHTGVNNLSIYWGITFRDLGHLLYRYCLKKD